MATMQACRGSAMMSSIQQPIGTNGSLFPSKRLGINGCPNHVKLSIIGPCQSSQLEGSLVTGRPPSSVSVPIPEIGGIVDYDMLEKTATPFAQNSLLLIADDVGAFLMMDMAHISGLVAASVVASPFEYCDIVTTTTHKGIDGARVEKILDMASITLNKNSVPGDKSALVPGGIRIGSPSMTTRGFSENEFIAVADFIHEGVQITREAKKSVSGSKLQDFMKFVTSPDFLLTGRVLDLQRRVEALTTQFPLPGQ
ncbi:Serine hydroxymethyltransferase 3, chloroplastic [Sesamum angolense]|uniref:Serine hydroxymethyltransferase 3, chloroplastic n=1 Tax=Sesamum angolense TaxID=2727404 RepID=A0AAE2BXB2_9LAMI|nr:Serine hydroxymethyltransferase 3, chloroplastic [Sesamum angolense]